MYNILYHDTFHWPFIRDEVLQHIILHCGYYRHLPGTGTIVWCYHDNRKIIL